MKPYYDDGQAAIYHGDCREVLPQLPQTLDLLIADPPYGVHWESGRRGQSFGQIAGDDGSISAAGWLAAALPRLRGRRHVYVFGHPVLTGLPLTGITELVWDKSLNGAGDLASPWAPAHEVIQFATYQPNKAHRREGDGRFAARLRRGSVIRVPRKSGVAVTRHPTEKPVDLLRQLIEASSLLGELVLDPFVGCGSTLVAAKLEGRSAIGIEIEERYCEIAARRLAQDVLPLV